MYLSVPKEPKQIIRYIKIIKQTKDDYFKEKIFQCILDIFIVLFDEEI